MDITMTAAGTDDAGTLERLAGITWRETYSGIISDDQIDYMLKTFQSSERIRSGMMAGDTYFIARCGRRDVGYMCIRDEGNVMFLSKIYVLREFQRMGVATSLLSLAAGECRRAGIGRMYLTVNRGNAGAIAFYLKSGFTIREDAVKDIGNGFVMDDHIMELTMEG